MANFALNVAKFAERAKGNTDQVVRSVLFSVANSLVERSPVGNPDLWQNPKAAPPGYVGGRFRANWQFGESEPNLAVTTGIDPTGGFTIGKLQAAVPETDARGKIYYFTNSLPYAERLEEGWSSRQAPDGIVGLTAIEFQDYVDKAVAELDK